MSAQEISIQTVDHVSFLRGEPTLDSALALAHRHVQQLEEEVQGLRRQVFSAQEVERRRIAQDLHDEAGHVLIEAIFGLDQAASRLSPDTEAETIVRTARQYLIDCAATLHEVVFALRPRLLEDLGLVAALRHLLDQASQASALRVDLVVTNEVDHLGQDVEMAIFRVVQEAVTNIYKHARATTIRVSLDCRPDRLTVAVEDDGVGLDLSVQRHRRMGGYGLAGIRERVEILGGTFETGRGPLGGTRLVARVPVRQAGGAYGRAEDPRGPYRRPRSGA